MGNHTIHRDSWYWEVGVEALDFTDYIQVSRTLIRGLGLHEAILIGELAYECRTWKRKGKLVDGWFYSTVENVERQTGINAHFQRLALENLVNAGVVEVKYCGLPRSRHIRLSASKVMELMADEPENTPSDQQLFTLLTTSDSPDAPIVVDEVNANKEVSKRNNKKKDSMSGNSDEPFEEKLKAIVDHLNAKVGSRYTTKNKQLRGYVHARLDEGFTVDDFFTVIDTKAAKWRDDPKMRDYLRPSTLFAPSHFEEYLNESPQTSILDTVDWDKYRLEQIDPSTIH